MLLGVLVGVRAPRRRSRCGGCCAPTTSEVRQSTKSMSQPPDPVRPSRLASLASRFPGHQICTIGPSALPSPSSLVIVVGCSAQQLSKVPGAPQITSINTNASIGGIAGGFHTKQLETILAVGALALLLPVLVFIGTAARLAAARREQRFAAMRLAGATPRQIGVISTVE